MRFPASPRPHDGSIRGIRTPPVAYGQAMNAQVGTGVAGIALLALLAVGCTFQPVTPPVSTSSSSPDASEPPDATPVENDDTDEPAQPTIANGSDDPRAVATVDGWIAELPVPPVAVRVDQVANSMLDSSRQGWWCSPMALKTAFWTVDGLSLADTYNWMLERSSPGLMSTSTRAMTPDESIDSTSFGRVPSLESLEGMAVTIVKTPTGSAIRAESGAFAPDTVCPTPEPGASFGGPGQG